MSYTGEDGKVTYFRLMDRLRPHWRRLAIALKFRQYSIAFMEHEDDPVYYLLSEWLRGANHEWDSKPVTWATLITALRDANVQEEAVMLEKYFVAMAQVESELTNASIHSDDNPLMHNFIVDHVFTHTHTRACTHTHTHTRVLGPIA